MQVIRKAGFQVKEQKAEVRRTDNGGISNIEYRTRNAEVKTDDGEQENKRMENLGFRIGGASPILYLNKSF